MALHDNPFADYRMFRGISESWELVKTGLIVVSGKSYKLELWHSFSNPDIPYYVAIFLREGDLWVHA